MKIDDCCAARRTEPGLQVQSKKRRVASFFIFIFFVPLWYKTKNSIEKYRKIIVTYVRLSHFFVFLHPEVSDAFFAVAVDFTIIFLDFLLKSS